MQGLAEGKVCFRSTKLSLKRPTLSENKKQVPLRLGNGSIDKPLPHKLDHLSLLLIFGTQIEMEEESQLHSVVF